VVSRRIPESYYDKIFYCEHFKAFTNTLIQNKFDASALKYEDARLVIPFFDEKKKMFAYAGRSLNEKSAMRYINIVLDENIPKIYGLDRWDKKAHTNVVEGPIDSMFIDNCLSTAGGSLISYFKDYDKDNFTIVYDNEPNSATTKAKILKAVDGGWPVCIWPKNIKEKDINAMILAGQKKEEISSIIKKNTFKGLEAHVKLL
jgi:hypothetical protein